MDLFKHFQTDAKAEVEGVWIPLTATSKLKIARFNNPKHQACVNRLTKPYIKPGMRASDIPDDTFLEIAREAVAECILVDWSGIVKGDEPVPYSKEAALAALQMNDFYETVVRASSSMDNFRVARLAEMEKNS